MRKDLADYNNFTEPGVEVHCLFTSRKPTVEKYAYRMNFEARKQYLFVTLFIDWILVWNLIKILLLLRAMEMVK